PTPIGPPQPPGPIGRVTKTARSRHPLVAERQAEYEEPVACRGRLLNCTLCQQLMSPQFHASRIATARVQPADARSIFTGKHETVKPVDGNCSRLCSFSMWQ